jgi:hypothetical protein
MFNLATPLLVAVREIVPRVFCAKPSKKVTLPVGAAPPEGLLVTVAVNVSSVPEVIEDEGAVRAVKVAVNDNSDRSSRGSIANTRREIERRCRFRKDPQDVERNFGNKMTTSIENGNGPPRRRRRKKMLRDYMP